MLPNIKSVHTANSEIVKILSGGVLLWEKEKILKVKWVKKPDSYINIGGFDPDGFYREYEFRDGKFYGIGNLGYYLGHDTYYVLINGTDTIKKLVYNKSTYNGPSYDRKETFYFDVFIGKVTQDYVI